MFLVLVFLGVAAVARIPGVAVTFIAARVATRATAVAVGGAIVFTGSRGTRERKKAGLFFVYLNLLVLYTVRWVENTFLAWV